jgi:hypothetical protein
LAKFHLFSNIRKTNCHEKFELFFFFCPTNITTSAKQYNNIFSILSPSTKALKKSQKEQQQSFFSLGRDEEKAKQKVFSSKVFILNEKCEEKIRMEIERKLW